MRNIFLSLLGLLLVAGCGLPTGGYGLQPQYPKNLLGMNKTVDSLQPTFRWEAFPRPRDLETDKEGKLRGIKNVSYDFKLWLVNKDSHELISSVEGLLEQSYRADQPLKPSSTYAWTVRARFEIDGKKRVTYWGSFPTNPRSRQLHSVNDYYWFKTPKSE